VSLWPGRSSSAGDLAADPRLEHGKRHGEFQQHSGYVCHPRNGPHSGGLRKQCEVRHADDSGHATTPTTQTVQTPPTPPTPPTTDKPGDDGVPHHRGPTTAAPTTADVTTTTVSASLNVSVCSLVTLDEVSGVLGTPASDAGPEQIFDTNDGNCRWSTPHGPGNASALQIVAAQRLTKRPT
jgi:hypothetical protein